MANNREPLGREWLPLLQCGGFVKETGLAVVVRDGAYFNPTPGFEAPDRADAKPEQTP